MNVDKLRKEIEDLDAKMRSALYGEDGELRDDVTPEVRAEVAADLKLRGEKLAELKLAEGVLSIEAVPARTIAPQAPNVIVKRDAMEVVEDRSSTRKQLADAAVRSVEDKEVLPENMEHFRSVVKAHSKDREWVRGVILRSSDDYASAWLKMISGREFALTTEERTVLGVSTNANGKFLLPTHLDPTIILTSALSGNEIRKLARVVTLTEGQPAWNGITSAGVTASWDGEVVEVSDDTPTFGQPSIPTERAQALVQASISAAEDISDLGNDVMMMFADAKDRLEGAAHANGAGTNDQPTGVFAAVAAVTASRVTSTTAATIGLVDLNAVYTGTPVRYRRNSTWVAAPTYTVAIKALGTALSASYSGDLTEPVAGRILGRPLVECEDAPTTQTTTALDREVLLGDFKQYVIVDRPGGMSVEYIPNLFATANNLPDGRRAWYATWRNGADVTNVDAFRLLVDRTSA